MSDDSTAGAKITTGLIRGTSAGQNLIAWPVARFCISERYEVESDGVDNLSIARLAHT